MAWDAERVRLRLAAVVSGLAVAALSGCAEAPQPFTTDPSLDTDIYVARGIWAENGPRFETLTNVTNRSGYDNQPHFLPDGSGFIYTAVNDDGLSDIWLYRLGAAGPERLTMTLTTEYVPKVLPDGDGFSSIRTEEGFSRLWSYSLEGRPQRVILRDQLPFGYYAWINPRQVAMVASYNLQNDRHGELQILDLDTDRVRTVAQDVGRCVAPMKDGTVVYVDKSEEAWMVRGINPYSGRERFAFPARNGNEDFAVAHDGSILMAEDRRVYRMEPNAGEWELVADWSDRLKGPISRLASSHDGEYLAVVAEAG